MIDDQTRDLADGLDDEEVALQHAVERLHERFPGVSRERIEHLLSEHHRQFDGAPVRDFVPVLIEHDVKAQLRSETEPSA